MSIKTTTYGFIPTQVSGCSLWLDAADSSTVTLSGSTVTQWNDKSGNGRNSTSCSATYSNRINGLSCMTNPIISGLITNSGSSIVTIFIVGTKASTGGLYDNMLALNLSPITNYYAAGTLFACYYGGTNPPQFYCYMNGNLSLSFVGAVNTPFIFNAFQTGTTGSTFGNGTSYGDVGTAGSTFNYTTYYIGACTGGPAWVGNICEIIVYNSILSISQRQQVESYLAQKWGITLSLAGHPGLTSTVYQSTYLKTAGPKRNIATMTPFYTAFSPRQIAGCSHWFDATDSSTITLSSGSLTQWNDKSGNGRNLTAVSGFANATVSSAYQNGLNVFNFFGNGLYRTALGNVSYPLEVYIIVALKSLTTHVDVLGMGDTSTDNFNSLTFSESAASRWHNGSSFGNRQTISTSDETSLSFLLIQWSIANGNYLLRRNGTQLIQASQTYSFNNSATAAFQIGFRHTNIDAANFSGYIGEIVVFNNQIGTTDRQNVESYLAQKWGLTASLPGGHLQLTQPAGARTALSLANSKLTLTNTVIVATGGTITTVGSFKFHTFTYPGGTFTVTANPKTVQVLVVGGGGGGGGYYNGGGGGAGGAVYNSAFSVSITSYTVTVGSGGAGASGGNNPGINGTSGGATTFSTLTGNGGGGGGADNNVNGLTGGCGGGMGPLGASAPGSGNQGYAGGYGTNGPNMGTLGGAYGSGYGGGGGGGMGSVGSNALTSAGPGWGGTGYTYVVGGQNYLVAGGGGGGTADTDNTNFGLGGSSIGGVGGLNSARVAGNGTANTGSGGGGYGRVGTGSAGGTGGTGIVVIAYRV